MLTRGASPRLDEIPMNLRDSLMQNALLFHRALPDEPSPSRMVAIGPSRVSVLGPLSGAPYFPRPTEMINRGRVGAGQRTSSLSACGRPVSDVPLPLKHSRRISRFVLSQSCSRLRSVVSRNCESSYCVVFQSGHFAACPHLGLKLEVTLGHRCFYLRDSLELAVRFAASS